MLSSLCEKKRNACQVLGQYVCDLMLSRNLNVLELYLVGCQELSCVVVLHVNMLGPVVGLENILVCQCISGLVIVPDI